MQIVHVENNDDKKGLVLRVKVGGCEFRQLQGNLNNICMFAVDTVTEPVKVTKTGARHARAKWLLLPVKMRNHYKSDEYDYDNMKCGCAEYKDKVLFVYLAERKGLG